MGSEDDRAPVHAVDVSRLAAQLSHTSTPYHDPVARIGWERLDTETYWLPPAAVSLYGLPEFEALPERTRIRLSQYEFLHFIGTGLWLEGLFMERIARAMNRRPPSLAALKYRLHELREEAGHSLMFLELMERSRLPLPAPRRARFLIASLFSRYAPMESAAFWMAVVIGEEVPDRLNRFIRLHAEEVCPVIAEMSSAHAVDEARHITYARETLQSYLKAMPAWQRALLLPLIRRLFGQFVDFFYYPDAETYELAGLAPGRWWTARARANPKRAEFVRQCLDPTLRLFAESGFALSWRKSG